MGKLRFVVLCGAAAIALGVAACGGEKVSLSGSIRIDGSTTVAPLTRAIAERFMAENPDVRVSVGTTGTDRGFKRFCQGETDANDASDTIDAASVAACEQNAVAWEEIAVVNDAQILIVNLQNPVVCLTTTQLSQIWHGNSEVTDYWGQVDDIAPPYDEQLTAYGPGTDTETFASFTKAVNDNEGETRDYNNALEKEYLTAQAIAERPGGIGYVKYSLYERYADALKALEIDSGDGCVAPSPETIADRTFKPLAHSLFVYPSADAVARPELQAFLRFYLDNAEEVAPDVGFIPLTDEQLDESRAKLDRLIADADRTTTTEDGDD